MVFSTHLIELKTTHHMIAGHALITCDLGGFSGHLKYDAGAAGQGSGVFENRQMSGLRYNKFLLCYPPPWLKLGYNDCDVLEAKSD